MMWQCFLPSDFPVDFRCRYLEQARLDREEEALGGKGSR